MTAAAALVEAVQARLKPVAARPLFNGAWLHPFDSSVDNAGTQCCHCWGWRDDPRHIPKEQPK